MAVTAYVTTQARLKLYDNLSELGESVLYCDTDSVIFIQNVDEPPKMRTDDYLGHLTDELEEFGAIIFHRRICVGWTKKLCVFCFLPLNRRTHDLM